jgi:hypothetical protein
VNKTHIAGSGVGAGFIALGINIFFPHANLTPDQMAFLVGVLPSAAMGSIAALEVVFPKTKAVFEAAASGAASVSVPAAK